MYYISHVLYYVQLRKLLPYLRQHNTQKMQTFYTSGHVPGMGLVIILKDTSRWETSTTWQWFCDFYCYQLNSLKNISPLKHPPCLRQAPDFAKGPPLQMWLTSAGSNRNVTFLYWNWRVEITTVGTLLLIGLSCKFITAWID